LKKKEALFEKSAQKLLAASRPGFGKLEAVNRLQRRRLTASNLPKPGREAAKSFLVLFFKKELLWLSLHF